MRLSREGPALWWVVSLASAVAVGDNISSSPSLNSTASPSILSSVPTVATYNPVSSLSTPQPEEAFALSNNFNTAKRGDPSSRPDLIKIVRSGIFDMNPSNMEKFDWVSRFKEWEDTPPNSFKSVSARYGEEKLGESHWWCDIDNGCSAKPNALSILELVDVTEPDMNRDEVIQEAQARYWAAVSIYSAFRQGTHTINAITRAQDFVLPRIDSIIYDFTKQEDIDAMLMCKIKSWFIDLMYEYTVKLVFAAVSFGVGLPVDCPDVAKSLETLKKATGNSYYTVQDAISLIKRVLDLTLPIEHNEGYWGKHPIGNESVTGYLRIAEDFTTDLYCGQMDGIAGTGDNNMFRIAEASYHVSEVMKEYLQNINDMYRTINGLNPDPKDSFKMSKWMFNANYEEVIHSLDSVDVAKKAQEFSHKLSGYFISACWASNKCYMKCEIHMKPAEVLSRCHDPLYAPQRYCPKEEPKTLCQVQCWTMMNSGNHEKALIGMGSLQKHGFTIDEAKQGSWKHSRNLTELNKPQPDYRAGKELVFGEGSALTLSVSVSRANKIADNPKKSKNFPCFNGRDYRGLDTEAFLTNLGMGPGSTDWGESSKESPRAWETFQQTCPELTRNMAPLTRYFNLVCAQRLYWPDRTLDNLWIHKRVLGPDYEGKNVERCAALREKTEGMDENTANHLFCTGVFPESKHIFENERGWLYTDYNSYKHRGTGLYYMLNHKSRCRTYLRTNAGFNINHQWLEVDWDYQEPKKPKMIDGEMDFKGTGLEMNDGDVFELETMPTSEPLDMTAVKEAIEDIEKVKEDTKNARR